MEKADFDRVWTLLMSIYPHSKDASNANTRRVWEEVLKPYDVERVTASVLDYARENKFFPRIAEITAGLLPSVVPAQAQGDKSLAWMKPYIEAHDKTVLDRYGGEAGWEAHRREMGWCS